jgi:ABC-2 type transport system permease protein
VPPGYLGQALRALAEQQPLAALLEAAALLLLIIPGFWIARLQMDRSLHTGGPTAGLLSGWPGQSGFLAARNPLAVLRLREALDLWRNPRARLLATVPLILIVMLKLFSARELLVFFFGSESDLWFTAALGLYAATLLAITFACNAFGHDGRALGLLLTLPVTVEQILLSKAQIQALATLLSGCLCAVFYWSYVSTGPGAHLMLILPGVAAMTPLLVSAGLTISILYPVSFDSTLNRRPRQPWLVSLFGLVLASLASLPLMAGLHLYLNGQPLAAILLLLLTNLIAWPLGYRMLPLQARLFERRRAEVLTAITRC